MRKAKRFQGERIARLHVRGNINITPSKGSVNLQKIGQNPALHFPRIYLLRYQTVCNKKPIYKFNVFQLNIIKIGFLL